MQLTSIRFTLVCGPESIEITTRRGAYRNLMDLVNDKIFVEDFGECRGIGRCATCLVSIHGSKPLPDKDRNEQATLEKAGVADTAWRLSCQLMIDESLDGSIITIAEQRPDVR